MYKKLFEPMKINQCEIPNRLAVTAMVTNYCDGNGNATERYICYHEEKAKGGFGLIITEDYGINEHAKGYTNIAMLCKDEQIESHKKLTDRIHQYETKIFAQIYHPGRQSSPAANGGVQVMSSSPMPCLVLREMPRELTIEEIEQFVEEFGDACLRAKKAGFDGVEIHGAHGYLLHNFLSPLVNKRSDKYGGSFERRTRIVKEVIENVRKKVGNDYPVIIRLSGEDCTPGGISKIEILTLCRLVEQWGVDAINISAGVYGGDRGNNVDMYSEEGWITELGAMAKRVVNIPIISSYRFTDPLVADTAIIDNRCDFIGMGRQSLADPHFPNKAKAMDFDSIRHCIACNQACFMGLFTKGYTSCLVNPEVGLEYKADYTKAEQPKNIMVIGGGLAGMQAAVRAAMRGHKVTVYEKKDRIGGQWVAAAYPPYKTGLATLPAWLMSEAEKQGVDIRLHSEVTEDLIREATPDSIILATGGNPLRPGIKGIDADNIYTAEEVLLGEKVINGKVVICGGGEVGCETAELVAQRAQKVDIVEMKPAILSDSFHAGGIMPILNRYQVGIHTNTKVMEFTKEGVVVEENNQNTLIPADHVILAMGYRSNNSLKEICEKYCGEVIAVGNASSVHNAVEAMAEGYRVGMSI